MSALVEDLSAREQNLFTNLATFGSKQKVTQQFRQQPTQTRPVIGYLQLEGLKEQSLFIFLQHFGHYERKTGGVSGIWEYGDRTSCAALVTALLQCSACFDLTPFLFQEQILPFCLHPSRLCGLIRWKTLPRGEGSYYTSWTWGFFVVTTDLCSVKCTPLIGSVLFVWNSLSQKTTPLQHFKVL